MFFNEEEPHPFLTMVSFQKRDRSNSPRLHDGRPARLCFRPEYRVEQKKYRLEQIKAAEEEAAEAILEAPEKTGETWMSWLSWLSWWTHQE